MVRESLFPLTFWSHLFHIFFKLLDFDSRVFTCFFTCFALFLPFSTFFNVFFTFHFFHFPFTFFTFVHFFYYFFQFFLGVEQNPKIRCF